MRLKSLEGNRWCWFICLISSIIDCNLSLRPRKIRKYWFAGYSSRVSTWRRRLSFHNAVLRLFFWVHYFLIDKFCNKVIKISFLLNPKKKSLITNNNILMGLSQLQIKWNFLLFYFFMLSCVQLLATPWTVACQAPLSMEFSRQEYSSGLPFPPLRNLSNPGVEPESPALAGGFFTTEPPGKPYFLAEAQSLANVGAQQCIWSNQCMQSTHYLFSEFFGEFLMHSDFISYGF